ncbi:MAG: DUF5908 family protein [Cyclobacteriaceae bacterium]
MAIEIKELIVRAVVDAKTETKGMAGNNAQGDGTSSILPYLESLMKNVDQKNER